MDIAVGGFVRGTVHTMPIEMASCHPIASPTIIPFVFVLDDTPKTSHSTYIFLNHFEHIGGIGSHG